MGTKSNPGKFDCYAKALPDEPIFVLLGRDRHAAETVRYWVSLRLGETDDCWNEKLNEAFQCANAMESFREFYEQLRKTPEDVLAELESLRAFKRSVDAALNSGDGSCRP